MSSFGPSPKDKPGVFGGTPKRLGAQGQRRITAKSKWGATEFESLDNDTLERKYPNILNFYIEPPGCDIRLETMELLAMERLRFLRIIEKYSSLKKDDQWANTIKSDLKSNALDSYHNLAVVQVQDRTQMCYQNRARDYFSHFILRLVLHGCVFIIHRPSFLLA
jgi:hypothetical protein